ncbi:DUF982 domain-containing protein [Falsirhodobacter xinxiangensis]|uniref:DUF982 domain-containing protein n=1 Tax=Falsirhodobacter xinxiangensis TaxID=2530049 RepID=UPI0010AB0747|nr:DUF982 domain-containing protein [Rhodobacter xinxiangensis]
MHRTWAEDIIFTHPETGRTVVLQDTGAAIVFLAEDWAWGYTPEYRAATSACYEVMEHEADHETARTAVAAALTSAGVPVRRPPGGGGAGVAHRV